MPSEGGKIGEAQDYLMEPTRLYTLMNERCTSFLLLDVRLSTDYKTCKIESVTGINISEEILQPGMTCKQIERQVHIEDRSTWMGRTNRDMLIVLDWTSSTFEESVPLSILKEAIQRWEDPSAKYKCEKKLHLLKGGLENFVLHYPTCVSNPHKARNPPQHAMKMGKKKFDLLSTNIDYPDLDAAFIASPSPGREGSPSVATVKQKSTPSAIEITSGAQLASKYDAVRTMKNDVPSGLVSGNLTGSLYPSTKDLKEIAFSSGAVSYTHLTLPTNREV